jgi:hypothetical protein
VSDATTPSGADRPAAGSEATTTADDIPTGELPTVGHRPRGAGSRVAAVPAGDSGDASARLRRRRRWLIAGVSVASALLVLAICGGLVAAASALDRISEATRDDRQVTSVRETACLELEERLNRVSPPGAAPDPPRRAAAIRNENAALRPYLAQLELRGEQWNDDDEDRLAQWRQLLDARTAYAEALDRQADSKVPAFFGNPRTSEGGTVAQRLETASPEACAASIRRLAAPDL